MNFIQDSKKRKVVRRCDIFSYLFTYGYIWTCVKIRERKNVNKNWFGDYLRFTVNEVDRLYLGFIVGRFYALSEFQLEYYDLKI